jgi:hypothetical protein
MLNLYADESWFNVIFVSGILGGGAAWLAGKAIAQTWRPWWHAALYMLLLGAVVRFVHFALFEATLLSIASYAADTVFLVVIGLLAWRRTQARQMVKQYDWLYEPDGFLSWRERQRPPPKEAGESAISG